MEKTSLKLVFLFSLTIILFCISSLGDAREMVNCLGGYCLLQVAHTMDIYETNASCHSDNDCIQYCPKGCKIVNCNFGTCFYKC
ncbi:putative defensin-like protein 263 [Eutrema salsugineum]|uniref:putative defensin-like protein 263 n=1 Tax=Eutrema salsugineum TaxID=72664 RepID=UPI000CED5082|nr:putative defensin-like protein 263 [Eutrema salsugineum]